MKEHFYYKLLMLPGLGPKRIHRLFLTMDEMEFTVERFLGLEESELMTAFDFSASMVRNLFQEDPDVEMDLDFMQAEEIQITAFPEKDYPGRLRDMKECPAPVFLHRGDMNILMKFTVGFSGSRSPAPTSAEAVRECVEVLSRHSANVVSGYCRGVDMMAHRTALSSGGATTVVMPQGIKHFRIGSLGDYGLNAGVLENLLVISQFPVGYPWTPEGAFARNKTICAFSDAVVLVEPKLKSGGTFYTGQTALKMRRPLFILMDRTGEIYREGEEYFVKKGAIPITRNKRGKLHLNSLLHGFKSVQ